MSGLQRDAYKKENKQEDNSVNASKTSNPTMHTGISATFPIAILFFVVSYNAICYQLKLK